METSMLARKNDRNIKQNSLCHTATPNPTLHVRRSKTSPTRQPFVMVSIKQMKIINQSLSSIQETCQNYAPHAISMKSFQQEAITAGRKEYAGASARWEHMMMHCPGRGSSVSVVAESSALNLQPLDQIDTLPD
jgi:hypothetical protein